MNADMDHLPKKQHDALIIIRHQIDRDIGFEDIKALIQRRFIEKRNDGKWVATSIGRDYVRRLK
ncbi:MAG TPA: hypothetical protein VFF75_03670 [Methylophilaceae bacterium]|nr:hypothetical protein [Methylophilaceae bacterium]